MSEEEAKPSLATIVADIAKEECRKLYEKDVAEIQEYLTKFKKRLMKARRLEIEEEAQAGVH